VEEGNLLETLLQSSIRRIIMTKYIHFDTIPEEFPNIELGAYIQKTFHPFRWSIKNSTNDSYLKTHWKIKVEMELIELEYILSKLKENHNILNVTHSFV